MAVGATITCGDYVDQSNGRCTSIDVLREDKLAVICTDTTFTPNLYYYVGKINRREIAWGNYMKYTTGKNPNVALFRQGGNVYTVECHDTNFFKCHYHIWRYSSERRRMEGKMNGRSICSERNPKICANNDGWIVAAFRGNKYAVGKVDFHEEAVFMKIDWWIRDRTVGSNPDVSMVGDMVVMAMTTNITLKTYVGKLHTDLKEVKWGNVIEAPGASWYPSIALNQEKQVLLGSQSIAGRMITLVHGTTEENQITWNRASKTTGFFGEYPSVVFHGRQEFFVNYKTNFGRSLRVKPGHIDIKEADNEDQLQQNPVYNENEV